MFTRPARRHLPHWEYPRGIVFLTWQLHRTQTPLTEGERDIVMDVLRRHPATECHIIAAVVMDDHCHVLTRLASGVTARKLAQAWKSISSHGLVKAGERVAPVWQAEYFDRWPRSQDQAAACGEYILGNPGWRWPGIMNYAWVIRG